MALVVPSGSINTSSLSAPGVIVQILPPSQSLINGVPSDIMGVIGSAQWGLKNTPVICGSMNEYVRNFGAPLNVLHDMGTHVYAASLTGASNFTCVRVTDGTDVAASKAILDVTTPTPVTGMTATAKYTGTLGNSIQITIGSGSAVGSYKVLIALPSNLSSGRIPEEFNNITGTGATLWANIVAAINNGQSGLRGPSELVISTVGTATLAPAAATYTLTGGLNGGVVTSANLIGVDVSPRTGMYALRGSQSNVGMLADLSDTATYADQDSFSLSEGIFMHITGPASQTLAQAKTAKNTAGIDNYDTKFLVGDWIYMYDSFNGLTRMISPQGFACGRKVSIAANQSALNKTIHGIIGTQTTMTGGAYSNADVVFACENGLDFIYNPSPRGKVYTLQTGQNTSSDPLIKMDDYTTLTNYLAYSIAGGIGGYIGELQTPTVRESAKATLLSFLSNLFQQRFIGDVNFPNDFSKACSVILDSSNNPSASVAAGYMQADIQVVDYAVIRNFIVNLQNGQVSLQSATPTP